MKTYLVTIPCTMAVCVEVEAESEEAAKEAAFEVDFNIEIKSEHKAEILDFEVHNRVSSGNVYYGCISINEIYAEEQ
jgi:hypothetical protein